MGMKFDSKPGRDVNEIFVDGSDAYANKKKAWITFRYPFNNRAVVFKAFITNYSDTFSPSFEEDQVYGRTDAIKTYNGTKRTISLGFDVVASTDEEAVGNLEKVQKLAQFMYPTYDNAGDASTISGPPIIRLGFMNMITSQGTSPNPNSPGKYLDDTNEETKKVTPRGIFEGNRAINLESTDDGFTATYDNDRGAVIEYGLDGLPGTISSVTYDFNLQNNANNVTVGTGAIFSKIISVSIGFDPIHEHVVDGSVTSPYTNFPYGVNLENLSGDLNRKLVVNTAAESDSYGNGPALTDKNNYLKDARQEFLARVAWGTAKTIDSEQINSGAEFLNDVRQEHRQRLAKLKESQQNKDMADARYKSLFGKSRLNRDERRESNSALRSAFYHQDDSGQPTENSRIAVAERALTEPYDFENN